MRQKKTGKRKVNPKGPFTTGQVAEMLGCAPRTAIRLCDEGRIPFYKLPGKPGREGHKRITVQGIESFLAKFPDIPRPEILRTQQGNS